MAGETIRGLVSRHGLSRNLIRIWVEKYHAGDLDENAAAVDLLQTCEAQLGALKRLVGRQALEQVDAVYPLAFVGIAEHLPRLIAYIYNGRRLRSALNYFCPKHRDSVQLSGLILSSARDPLQARDQR